MNDYASLRKQNKKSSLAAVVALMLCVVLSASLLFSRLMTYTPADKRLYIPLTQSNRMTHVTAHRDSAYSLPSADLLVAMPAVLAANPGFEAADDNTVWEGKTEVEIFRMSYSNSTGDITVRSQDGRKVLAPGTSNTYNFALKNTGNVSLDYAMSMEAYFSDGEHTIPVVVRVTDYLGNYLAGSAGEKVDALALNEVAQSGVIAAGNIYPYTLEWEWPFESGDDAYDTKLGNLAVGEDISLTIVIKTTAEGSDDPGQPGGTPETGDTTNVAMLAGMMVVSLAGILFLLLIRRRKESNEED